MPKLEVKVSIKDTDLFSSVIELVKDFTQDKRVSNDIRTEYYLKMCELYEKYSNKANVNQHLGN